MLWHGAGLSLPLLQWPRRKEICTKTGLPELPFPTKRCKCAQTVPMPLFQLDYRPASSYLHSSPPAEGISPPSPHLTSSSCLIPSFLLALTVHTALLDYPCCISPWSSAIQDIMTLHTLHQDSSSFKDLVLQIFQGCPPHQPLSMAQGGSGAHPAC